MWVLRNEMCILGSWRCFFGCHLTLDFSNSCKEILIVLYAIRLYIDFLQGKHDCLQKTPQWLRCTMGEIQTRKKTEQDGELRHASLHDWTECAPVKHPLENPLRSSDVFMERRTGHGAMLISAVTISGDSCICSTSSQLWQMAWAY